jgi:hypothetical protein
MSAAFADTSFFLAILTPSDPAHGRIPGLPAFRSTPRSEMLFARSQLAQMAPGGVRKRIIFV